MDCRRGLARRVPSTPPICRPRLVAAVLASVGCAASAFAQSVLVVEHHGHGAVVCAAHGNDPCVNEDGHVVVASGHRYVLKHVDEYLPVFVSIRHLDVHTSGLAIVETGGEINHQLNVRAELASAYPLKDVFVVFELLPENGPQSIFLQEAGELSPDQPRTLDVVVPLSAPLGDGRYKLHVFCGGQEVLTSQIPFDRREAILDRMIARRIKDRPDGPPSVFIGPAPEYPARLKKAKGETLLQVRILATGAVADARVLRATEPAFGESALAAVRQWRFLPKIQQGHAVATTVNVPLKFSPPARS